jgi:hypothetical protein
MESQLAEAFPALPEHLRRFAMSRCGDMNRYKHRGVSERCFWRYYSFFHLCVVPFLEYMCIYHCVGAIIEGQFLHPHIRMPVR